MRHSWLLSYMGRKVPGNITETWENGVISLFCQILYGLGHRQGHTHTARTYTHTHGWEPRTTRVDNVFSLQIAVKVGKLLNTVEEAKSKEQ